MDQIEQIIKLSQEGFNKNQITKILNITGNTPEPTKKQIKKKLGVKHTQPSRLAVQTRRNKIINYVLEHGSANAAELIREGIIKNYWTLYDDARRIKDPRIEKVGGELRLKENSVNRYFQKF